MKTSPPVEVAVVVEVGKYLDATRLIKLVFHLARVVGISTTHSRPSGPIDRHRSDDQRLGRHQLDDKIIGTRVARKASAGGGGVSAGLFLSVG